MSELPGAHGGQVRVSEFQKAVSHWVGAGTVLRTAEPSLLPQKERFKITLSIFIGHGGFCPVSYCPESKPPSCLGNSFFYDSWPTVEPVFHYGDNKDQMLLSLLPECKAHRNVLSALAQLMRSTLVEF